MSHKQSAEESGVENNSKKRDYDPKLDFFSDKFDPLLALQRPDAVPPIPNAKIYDNIHMYKSATSGEVRTRNRGEKDESAPSTSGGIQRRWQPHQLPIKTERVFTRKNVFTQMESIEGPLQLLRICKDKRLRIKVWTRHGYDIRGYCLAYVIAFDKHWNLALEDVDEVWTRPKKRKVPALEGDPNRRFRPKVLPPPVVILESTKKTETCSRHIDQLMMRGEHVALISVISESNV